MAKFVIVKPSDDGGDYVGPNDPNDPEHISSRQDEQKRNRFWKLIVNVPKKLVHSFKFNLTSLLM